MLDLAATMEALGDALRVDIKNTYPWAAESVSVPCAVVGYPSDIDFTTTIAQGADGIEFPVYLLVGKASTKAARDQLSGMITSARTALDNASPSWRVTKAQILTVPVAGVEYIGAMLTVSVYA